MKKYLQPELFIKELDDSQCVLTASGSSLLNYDNDIVDIQWR